MYQLYLRFFNKIFYESVVSFDAFSFWVFFLFLVTIIMDDCTTN